MEFNVAYKPLILHLRQVRWITELNTCGLSPAGLNSWWVILKQARRSSSAFRTTIKIPSKQNHQCFSSHWMCPGPKKEEDPVTSEKTRCECWFPRKLLDGCLLRFIRLQTWRQLQRPITLVWCNTPSKLPSSSGENGPMAAIWYAEITCPSSTILGFGRLLEVGDMWYYKPSPKAAPHKIYGPTRNSKFLVICRWNE